jgi:hypothetical protein
MFEEAANRQTSGESASLPQYLGCNTVFDMRLRVIFLRRKTVSLQSNIVHKLFPTVRANSTNQYGRPTTTIIHRKVENPSQYFLILTILLSGDIHYNPGPVKHPYTDCNKPVKSNQKAVYFERSTF